MGWLWATPSPGKDAPSASSSQHATAATPPATTTTTTPQRQESSEFTDPELQKFIALFQADMGSKTDEQPSAPAQLPSKTEATPVTSPSSSTSSSSSSWFSFLSSKPTAQPSTNPAISTSTSATSSPTSLSSLSSEIVSSGPGSDDPAAPLDPLSESLLPTDMSCRQAFDLAFHCQSLGGQWNAVYRYGSMRSCSEQWDDFWFCMRTKGYTGPLKEEAVRAHYRAKERAKYHRADKPSSEDVWEKRTERLPWGEAFAQKYEPPEMSDEEWQRAQMERRAKAAQEAGTR